jgi:hypothetical protein
MLHHLFELLVALFSCIINCHDFVEDLSIVLEVNHLFENVDFETLRGIEIFELKFMLLVFFHYLTNLMLEVLGYVC